MGTTIELRKLKDDQILYRLLIYSKVSPEIEAAAFSLNKAIATELIQLKPSCRTIQLENCFVKLLEELPEYPIIKDIDTMFNPEYKVDVMKILVLAYKRKPFRLIWPGGCSDGRLTYSEEGFPDYKSFGINDYDIICVI